MLTCQLLVNPALLLHKHLLLQSQATPAVSICQCKAPQPDSLAGAQLVRRMCRTHLPLGAELPLALDPPGGCIAVLLHGTVHLYGSQDSSAAALTAESSCSCIAKDGSSSSGLAGAESGMSAASSSGINFSGGSDAGANGGSGDSAASGKGGGSVSSSGINFGGGVDAAPGDPGGGGSADAGHPNPAVPCADGPLARHGPCLLSDAAGLLAGSGGDGQALRAVAAMPAECWLLIAKSVQQVRAAWEVPEGTLVRNPGPVTCRRSHKILSWQ